MPESTELMESRKGAEMAHAFRTNDIQASAKIDDTNAANDTENKYGVKFEEGVLLNPLIHASRGYDEALIVMDVLRRRVAVLAPLDPTKMENDKVDRMALSHKGFCQELLDRGEQADQIRGYAINYFGGNMLFVIDV